MSVLTIQPQFLYPHSRQFPFDEVAEKIVREIEKRNWNVPGITIEFDTYGSGESKYQLVRQIIGEDFRLCFIRNQGSLDDRWNDTAALSEICIPKQIISVYTDESGPRYYLYVGTDWNADKEWFMKAIKVNSKLDKKPRKYLMYKGNPPWGNHRAEELIADDDLGREYSPEGNEPVRIDLEQKFEEFATWLKQNVLDYILSFPEGSIIQPSIEKLIPYEGTWHTLYSLCGMGDLARIRIGKSELLPYERHAYFGEAYRLVPLVVHCDNRFPEIAYEGFIWCDTKKELMDEVKFAMGCLAGNKTLVAINLKYANHVYVADNSKYEETRRQLFENIAPRHRLTDEEVGMALAARGATIVPITEYKGDYKEPIVLINREIDFAEVELI